MNWLIAQNIPQVFRVAIDFNEDVAQQLSQQILPGVSGISDSGTIAIQWFNVARDGMLMMPGAEVISQNDLIRVDYGNSDQMMRNNMAMMVRIFNQRKASDVLQRLFNYCFIAAKRANTKELANFIYFMEYTAFWQHLSWEAEKQNIQVNSVDELANWAHQVAPEVAADKQGDWGREMMTLPVDVWKELIRGSISEIGRIYQDEGEWIIEDQNLRIPTGSTLYIMLPSISEEHWQMWNNPEQQGMLRFLGVEDQINKIEQRKQWISQYGLDRIYRIRYVDDQSLSEAKSDYFKRRDES